MRCGQSQRLQGAISALMSNFKSYTAPVWLPSGHAQTIYASTFMRMPKLVFRRERWDTPDGDFIDLDWVDGPETSPLVVLFHGLEGNSSSHYSLYVMAELKTARWRGVVAHFRGCSGELNYLPRAYHSGDADEIEWIVKRLKAIAGNNALFAIGVSLGGNALLKWLGLAQMGDILRAAVALSAPVDLHVAGRNLEIGFNKIYTQHFLRSLKKKSLLKLACYPRLFDKNAMLTSNTLYEFDNIVTAPLHGFRDTDDYWSKASSKSCLKSILTPTLLINARNDPFFSPSSLPRADEVSSNVYLEYPDQGGHVGFIDNPFPGKFNTLLQRIIYFFSGQL